MPGNVIPMSHAKGPFQRKGQPMTSHTMSEAVDRNQGKRSVRVSPSAASISGHGTHERVPAKAIPGDTGSESHLSELSAGEHLGDVVDRVVASAVVSPDEPEMTVAATAGNDLPDWSRISVHMLEVAPTIASRITKVVSQLNLTPDEQRFVLCQLPAEFERRLPQIVTGVAVV